MLISAMMKHYEKLISIIREKK